MKKVLCKSLSTFLALIMLLSAVPMFVMAADENEAPVFTVDTVEETTTELTLKLSITSGSFVCFDATVTVDGLTCTSVYTTDDFNDFAIAVKRSGGSSADCENADNGKVSVSVTESCSAPMDIIIYTFSKPTAAGVNGKDVSFTLNSCYVADGNKEIDVLGDAEAEVVLPETHVHNVEWTIDKEATCKEEGSKTSYCLSCGEKVETKSIDKKEHANTHEEKLEAKCEEAGYYKLICDDCGTVITEENYPATGHGETRTERKAATCTEAGYVKEYCTVCEKLVSETVLPAKNHSETREETKTATCTEDGYVKTFCKLCGDLLDTKVIKATGHIGETYTETKNATCTEAGYVKTFCKDCDTLLNTETIPAKGHGEGKLVRKDKTCTEDGYIRYICPDCHEILEERILKCEGHSYVDYTIEPTCTEKGHQMTECSVCHDVKKDVVLPAKGHDWTSWSRIKDPTYRSKGTDRRTCKHCDAYEDREVAMLKAEVEGVKMSLPSLSMNYKKYTRLYADVMPEDAAFSTDIVWSSSNTKVATVDENGTVTATGTGTAVITASTADGKFSDTCTVTVTYSWLQWIIIYILFGWIWYM